MGHKKFAQNNFPCSVRKCSTTGPSASAGKYVSAPTSNTVPISNTVNVTPDTGNVPALCGTIFFCASDPARAMIGTIIKNRPINVARPRVVLYHGSLPDNPAKALPLLPVQEVNA